MISIDPAELDRFLNGIDAWEIKTKRRCDEVFRGLCVAAFNCAMFATPQWSGSAASNWNISFDGPDFSVDARPDYFSVDEESPFSKLSPNPGAFDLAVVRNETKASAIKIGVKTVFISNGAKDIDDEVYIQKLEENPNSYLRPENDPGGMLNITGRALMGLTLLSLEKEAQLRALNLGDEANAGVR